MMCDTLGLPRYQSINMSSFAAIGLNMTRRTGQQEHGQEHEQEQEQEQRSRHKRLHGRLVLLSLLLSWSLSK